MAESDYHRELMTDYLLHPLQERYRQQSDVYVSGNLFLYYEEGNTQAVVAPDVFVVFGVPKRLRNIYKLWEEGRAPDVVFELTSKSTWREDMRKKRKIYERLGVREYFLFDPLQEYLRPNLRGFRLADQRYVEVDPEPWERQEWQLHSHVLDLTLQTAGPILRLYDPEQDRFLRSRPEEARARREEAQARREEARARRLAEARAAWEAQARREEARARRAAEAEVERLRAMLAQRDGGDG